VPLVGTLARMVTAAPRRGGSSVTMRRAAAGFAASFRGLPMVTAGADDRTAPVTIAAECGALGFKGEHGRQAS